MVESSRLKLQRRFEAHLEARSHLVQEGVRREVVIIYVNFCQNVISIIGAAIG
jgi:hypothetical protein